MVACSLFRLSDDNYIHFEIPASSGETPYFPSPITVIALAAGHGYVTAPRKDWEQVLGDIFQEVDEELRKDKMESLWKEYGRYAVGVAVAIVVVVAGWKGWTFYAESRLLAASQQYEVAGRLLSEGKTTDARALFAGLASDGHGQYKTLARFREAALLGDSGDIGGAVAAYAKISGDEDLSRTFRDAATLFSVMYRIDQPSADAAALKNELEPLRAGEGPWRFSAGELIGLLEIRSGDLAAARTTFQGLADALDAPQGLRARATQVLAVIGQS